MSNNDDGKRSVLGRAFEILDCFAGGAEMTVAGICERTGLPPATVHRMLAALVRWEGVERLSHGRYRLGRRIWSLGIGAPQVRRLRELAQPYLVDLHVATRGTVYLGVRDGSDGIFSDRITRVKPTANSSRVTRRLPLHRTGGGRVLLAYSPEAWDELVADSASDPEMTARIPELRAQLAEIRRTGVGIARNDGLPGRTSVAAAVLDSQGAIVASVTVAFPESRIPQPQQIVPRVIATARAISRDLAATGEF
ncbi:IclR family transcriptional regulator [Rhodococcus rhodochrous]|uniref:IclR family transcriptional regulator n=1 Tax=Rhodococcus rhodochrous TaxID=1829 RepID=A0AA46WXY2_RHORH|nr:IclR family transcriptional regulator [Rhodococcus rhodochrous]UZF45421.1 IclR family transcriptional regulator [Rhodococcus rhodochrous]